MRALRCRRMLDERTKTDLTEDVRGEALLSVLLLQGLVPVGRGEFQDSALGPRGQQAQEVAQVGEGLDPVELATREEGDESCVGPTALVAADEDPIVPAMPSSA